MKEQFERSRIVLGDDAIERLGAARVALFGVGGVGGFCAEALARAGVGAIDLFDNDTVAMTNLNRQIIALHSTVGRPKVEVMRERILDINPDCRVTAHRMFYLPETAGEIDFSGYDFVADAIDTVTAKIDLICRAKRAGVPVISAMGAGNKLDPTRFEVADLSKTSVCPLARVMRLELRKRGITGVRVVYSREEPQKPGIPSDASAVRRNSPGSVSFVPPVVGMIMAGEIIRTLAERK